MIGHVGQVVARSPEDQEVRILHKAQEINFRSSDRSRHELVP